MSSKRQFLVFLIFVIGCIFLLSLIFNGNGRQASNSKQPASKKIINLTDYADKDSRVVAITDGRINGEDTHRAIRITIDKNYRKIEIVQGYQGNVIQSSTQENNSQAYSQFLSALARTGFGKTRKGTFISETGVCASGKRYIFELFNDDKSVSRTWTANCIKGSSPASPESVNALFRRQITDYDKITNRLTL